MKLIEETANLSDTRAYTRETNIILVLRCWTKTILLQVGKIIKSLKGWLGIWVI